MFLIPQPATVIQTDNSTVTYQTQFLTQLESTEFYNYFLHNLNWSHDQAKIYGKTTITKRKIAWFADDGLNYNYSGVDRIATGWEPKVLNFKNVLEKQTGCSFNSCLLNLYHNGQESMAWHSDDQNHLEKNSAIAIVSLGAERFFKLRETSNKSNQRKILLEQGSLLLMLGETQKYWQHEIPKMASIKDIRISLTFRTMKNRLAA
jgi:alkylated DNA repair dioxygenase AlkB